MVLWCSWLSLLSNTQAVPGSSPGGINLLLFLPTICIVVLQDGAVIFRNLFLLHIDDPSSITLSHILPIRKRHMVTNLRRPKQHLPFHGKLETARLSAKGMMITCISASDASAHLLNSPARTWKGDVGGT